METIVHASNADHRSPASQKLNLGELILELVPATTGTSLLMIRFASPCRTLHNLKYTGIRIDTTSDFIKLESNWNFTAALIVIYISNLSPQ